MRTFAATAGLAAALAPFVPAPAAHAAPSVIASDAASPALASGGRYAAFLSAARTLRVIDTAKRAAIDVAAPPECSDPVVLQAVGGEQALVGCDARYVNGGEGTHLLLDLPSGRWHEPVGATRFLSDLRENDMFASFSAVGSRWLAGTWTGYQDYARIFLDWRTGETVVGDGDAEVMPDLDAETVLRPLCPPFFRRHNPRSWAEQPFFDFPYDPPFRIAGTLLRRCGDAGPGLRIERVRAASSVTLSDGYVTWLSRDGRTAARAFLPLCGVRFTWPVGDADLVRHTAHAIFVTRHEGSEVDRSYDLRTQRRPACPGVTLPGAIRLRRGSALASARLVSARWPASADGSPELLRPVARTTSRLPARGGDILLSSPAGTERAVRWRFTGRPWHSARRHGGRWRLGVRGRGLVTIGVRSDDGSTARFAVRVA